MARLLVACAAPMATLSMDAVAAPAVSVVRYGPPPAGDLWAAWMRERSVVGVAWRTLRRDDDYVAEMLAEPLNPYSDLTGRAFPVYEAFFETAALHAATAHLGTHVTPMDMTRMLAWDLGLTKAHPGLQVPVRSDAIDDDTRAGANLRKAGIDYDAYRVVARLVDTKDYAVAGAYLVALQLVKEKSETYWRLGLAGMPQWHGIQSAVRRRFLGATADTPPSDYDLYYLRTLLQGELSHWHAGGTTMYGFRQLPVHFRMARAAAALRDGRGYATGHDPCDTRGLGKRLVFHDPHTLCFVDATDRAVLEWFVDDLLASFAGRSPDGAPPTLADRMTWEMSTLNPLWLGLFDASMLTAAMRTEVVEWLADRRGRDALPDGGEPAYDLEDADRLQDRALDALGGMVSP
ncbi:hypothetical protein FIV34_02235 [Luteibacter pinisoli]|uniref:Uncharacterized protein n=1 Tax=Luteibacter pinisoli TaxID=2589080 RepID=A0A4Y5YZ19_9GAMM|nr:hypothetical protein [Luteibacter pinisoli]QDE38097.1 hypothetical protein FIV34_02235 [Luteibacter pinisoli]